MNENFKPEVKTPEEIAKWREEHKDELNPKNRFMNMPDGTVVEVTEENKEELTEDYRDSQKEIGM